MRRGQTFGEADFPDTPQQRSKAWLFLLEPEAIHLLGNDALSSRVEPDRAFVRTTFHGSQT